MANPQQVLVSTYESGSGAMAQSAVVTFSFVMTSGFYAQMPIIIYNATSQTAYSAGAVVTTYRSSDYGSTWENVGSVVASFPTPTTQGQIQSRDIALDPGWYLISVVMTQSAANTFSCLLGTAWEISAYA